MEVRYMVNGCGKKIPATRTVVVKLGDEIVYEKRTQDEIEKIMGEVRKNNTPPPLEPEKRA